LPLTGCANRVELDPRDVEAVEEITRIAKEVRLVVKSAYFGAVKVSVVSQRGGMPIRIDRFGHGEDQIMVSKSKFGDGHISLLLETPDADRFGGVVSDVGASVSMPTCSRASGSARRPLTSFSTLGRSYGPQPSRGTKDVRFPRRPSDVVFVMYAL
jgi:hypothetical protein